MRIRGIHVEGFGGLGPLDLTLSPGLNVILGPNEAGKTCLMEFVRALLFGMSRRDKAFQRYLPLDGRPYGGRMVLEEDGREWVYRARFPGVPRVEGEEGEPFPRDTGNLLFSRVFSLGLAQVSNLALLSGDEMAQHLYSTALGPLGKAYAQAVGELEKRREALYKVKGRTPLVNRLLVEVRAVEADLSRLRRLPDRYKDVLRELEGVEKALEEVTREWMEVRRERQEWEILAKAHPLFSQLKELLSTLKDGGFPSSFPPQGLERLEEIEKELERARGELEEVRLLLKPLEEALARPLQGKEVLAKERDIGALREEWALIKEKRRRLVHIDSRLSLLEKEVGEGLAYLGLETLPPRPTGAVWEGLEGFMEEFSSLDRERLALEKELELRGSERDKREKDLEALKDQAPPRPPLSRDEVMTRQDFVSQARDHLFAVPSLWGPGFSLFFLLLGVGGAWMGMEHGWAVPQWGGFALALAGVVGLVNACFRRFKWRREARRLIGRLEIEGLEREVLDRVDRDLKDMEEAWRQVDYWRIKCSDLERALGLATKEMEKIRGDLEALETREEALGQRWKEWLGTLGLPPVSSPKSAQELLHRLDEIHRSHQEMEALAKEREVLKGEVEDFLLRLKGLVEALGMEFRSLEEGMVSLSEALEDGRKELEERRALETEAGPLREKAKLLQERLERKERELEALLKDGGVASGREFREKALKWKRRESLEGEIHKLRLQLATLLGDQWEDWGPRLLSLSPGEAGEKARELGEREEKLERERDGLIEAKTRLVREKEELEGEEGEQVLAQERESLLESLREAALEWTVETLALVLFRRTREVYERENQPRVLREASRFFSTMTGGRYQRVFIPMGVRELWVERRDGARLSSAFLSRGTGEQLYLALSMAIMLEVAERGMAFPVVLDDILVNFDPPRAARAVEAIGSLSSRLQVLFFTCHPHVKDLFASLEGVEIMTLGS